MAEYRESREFLHLAGSLGLLALHGGRIEPGTEEIARFVSSRSRASLYVYSGQRPARNRDLHRPSQNMEIDSWPLVLQFLSHVNTVISIHGHGRNLSCAYVGGLNQRMVQRFIELLGPALPGYEWISDPDCIPRAIRGCDPRNVVNLPPARGMQLELPRTLRQTKPTSRGEFYEPAGEALILSGLLIEFVGKVMDSDS
ncbi:MAG: poly-gamma-glutamate hydrolase family protein [Deltaproteobacteria bacterium]|nr:MAG: poly-gamma-glutamate hydrolase family protein [Deltaproteobacteria bacterium]